MNFTAKCTQIRLGPMEAPWNNLHKCVQVNQWPVPLLLRPDLMMGSPSCPSHGSGHKNKGRSDTMQMNPNRKKKEGDFVSLSSNSTCACHVGFDTAWTEVQGMRTVTDNDISQPRLSRAQGEMTMIDGYYSFIDLCTSRVRNGTFGAI